MNAMANKVFCIGWHKTGTTTIGEALLLLGYNVVGARLDFADALLNKDIESVLKEAEKYEAFQDVPWAGLYRELDINFPDSKFILIERDPEKWLKSAIKHFGDRNIKMHAWMYGNGNITGNEKLYIEKYQQHNNDVREYFANRPDDLLIISLENGEGWEKLCPFLSKPIPEKDFPHANKGKHNYTFWERVYSYWRSRIPTKFRRKILTALGVEDRRNRFNNFEKNKYY